MKKSRSRSRVDGKPNPNPKAKQRRRSGQPKLIKKKEQPEAEEEPPIKQKRKQATPKRMPPKEEPVKTKEEEEDKDNVGFLSKMSALKDRLTVDNVNEFRKKGRMRGNHQYKVNDYGKECSFMMGRLANMSESQVQKETLVSYPIACKGVIFKMCFLQSEMVDIINSWRKKNSRARFPEPMLAEMQEALDGIKCNIKLEPTMNEEFEDTMIEYGSPLMSGADGMENTVLQGMVLNYMIDYMKSVENYNPGSFYNQVRNIGLRLVKGSLWALKWVLAHPILSSLMMMVVRVVKILVCFYFSNTTPEYMDAMLNAGLEFLGEGPVTVAFKSVIKGCYNCIWSCLKGGVVWGGLSCFGNVFSVAYANVGEGMGWMLQSTGQVVVGMFEGIIGSQSYVGRHIFTITAAFSDPWGYMASWVGGDKSFKKMITQKAALGQFIYNLKMDRDIVSLSIFLELVPYKYLESFIVMIIDNVGNLRPDAKVWIESLKLLHGSLMGTVNAFVSAMTGVRERLSCLDLVIYIYQYNRYGSVIGEFLGEVKSLLFDVLPCFMSSLWYYFIKLLGVGGGADVNKSCCMTDVVESIKKAMDMVQSWTRWDDDGEMTMVVEDEVMLRPSHLPEKKYDALIVGKNKMVSFGQRGASDFTKHRDEERRLRYIVRHSRGRRENWKNWETRGFWSRWLLWNKKTVDESIADIERRFPLKIRRSGMAKKQKQTKKKSKSKKTTDDELSLLLGSMKL